MNGRTFTLIASAALSAGAVLAPHVAEAQNAQQPVPPMVPRSSGLDIMSNVAMAIGVGTVTLMPRVYYSDPEATVGWKARWHVSVLAPALTLTSAVLLTEFPIKNAIKSPRPGCSVDQTLVSNLGFGCKSFGGPDTHSMGAWSAFGAGTGIWVADTFIHSDGNVHAGSIVGNMIVPLIAGVITSVGRGVAPSGDQAWENPGQIGAGVAVGIPVGFLIGIGYAALAKPNCGYGNNVICW